MPTLRTLVPAAACALAAITLSIATPEAAFAARCTGADTLPHSARSAAQARHATLCLINRERRAAGLRKLHANASLRSAARAFSHRMVAEGFFDHVTPDGRTLQDRVGATRYVGGWPKYSLAENIGYGSGSLGTPRSIVQAWMNSPPHRANILDGRYRHAGLGIVPGEPGIRGIGATFTVDFGARSHC
jgi:uncharacterized protein YkwD